MEERWVVFLSAGTSAAFCYCSFWYLCSIPAFRKEINDHFWLQPNYLSIWRTLLFLVGTVLYFSFEDFIWYVVAVHFLAIGAVGDAIDGLVARHCECETEIGKWLDPFLDKISYLTPLTVLAYQSCFSVLGHWLAVIVEIVFGQFIVRKILQKSHKSVAAITIGKIKAILFYLLFFFCDLARYGDISPVITYWLQLLCLILAFLSAVFKLKPLLKP